MSEMNLYECEYDVKDDYSTFHIKDYVWSTTPPSTGGHFWKTIKAPSPVVISNYSCKEVDPNSIKDITFQMTNHKWNERALAL